MANQRLTGGLPTGGYCLATKERPGGHRGEVKVNKESHRSLYPDEAAETTDRRLVSWIYSRRRTRGHRPFADVLGYARDALGEDVSAELLIIVCERIGYCPCTITHEPIPNFQKRSRRRRKGVY